MLPRWYPNIEEAEDGNFIKKHIESIASRAPSIVLFIKGIDQLNGKRSSLVVSSDQAEYLIYFKLNKGPLSSIINPLRYFKYQLAGYRIIRKTKDKPALCHVHVMARSSLLANYLRFFQGIPFIVSEHWSGYYPESGKLTSIKQLIYRLLFVQASRITAVSDSLALAIKDIGVNKTISVIPNVVDDVFFRKEAGPSKSEIKHLLHISNLKNSIKQTDKIIEYLDELAAVRSDFDLTIIGDGPDRSELEIQGQKLHHLKDRIVFTGNISSDQVADYFSTACASLLFSKFETQSVVLLESISMSVPVIAPNVGGIPEHFADKGILFEAGSKNDFINSVQRILDGEIKLEREKMRNYAKSQFTQELIAEKFLSIYKEIKPDLNV